MAGPLPSKICAACGRSFAWRKKWERSWPEVRYCSKACSGGPGKVDRALEQAISTLLDGRSVGATICPSEVARLVDADQGGSDESWRELMEPARRAARRLVAAGAVVITQKGNIVDPSTAKGPIRIRKVQRR